MYQYQLCMMKIYFSIKKVSYFCIVMWILIYFALLILTPHFIESTAKFSSCMKLQRAQVGSNLSKYPKSLIRSRSLIQVHIY